MPRDLLRQLFDINIQARQTQMQGRTLSRFRLTPYDPAGVLMPVADIELSGVILSGIPLAATNRELTNILPGTPVTLSRSSTGRLEVTGVSKRGGTSTYCYMMTLPELTPQTSGGTSALAAGALVSMGTIGVDTRRATFGELADMGGFGIIPLEAQVLTDMDGTFIRVIG